MADPYPTILSRITATKECVLRWVRDGEKIRPPQEVFQEEVHFLEDSIQKDRDIMGSSSDPDQLSSAFDRAVGSSGKLKELQINYKTTASEKEASYQQDLEAHLGGLAKEIVDTLGIRLIEEVLRAAHADLGVYPQPNADRRVSNHPAICSTFADKGVVRRKLLRQSSGLAESVGGLHLLAPGSHYRDACGATATKQKEKQV